MKIRLLLMLMAFSGFAQAPVIEGDLMLCPQGSGTAYIVNDQAYDSYQWYWKYWFDESPFEAIENATEPTFTYDWVTYDQALLKVEVMLDGEVYQSNVIQIDSYNWVPLTTAFEMTENISINPENGNVVLCEGTSFSVSVSMPYTIVQWYRDGAAIPEATSMQFEISGPGIYHVEAAPDVCPDSVSSSAGTPLVVEINANCGLHSGDFSQAPVHVYPNPASNVVYINSRFESGSIYNLSGQLVSSFGNAQAIDVSNLSSGVYILKAVREGISGYARLVIK